MSTSHAPVNRRLHFAVLVVIFPLVLAVAASWYGFRDDDSFDALVLFITTVTVFAVIQTQILSAVESHRSDLHRRAPLPLTIASAGAASTLVLVAFGPSEQPVVEWAVAGGAAVAAAVVAWLTVRRLLPAVELPAVGGPAPAGAIRHESTPDRTPVWTGQAPIQAGRTRFQWVGFYAGLGVAMSIFVLASGGWDSSMFGFVLLFPFMMVNVPMRFRAARVRVSIGPAGVVVRSGLTRTEYLSTPLDHVDSAWITDNPKPNTNTSWGKKSSSTRLEFLTREGPALMVRFADGSDLIVSMDEPSEPAAVLNELLDRRPALLTGDTSSTC